MIITLFFCFIFSRDSIKTFKKPELAVIDIISLFTALSCQDEEDIVIETIQNILVFLLLWMIKVGLIVCSL